MNKKRNRFITKILFAYLSILLLGVCVASVFISNVMIEEIIHIQSKYEAEVLENVRDEMDIRVRNINKIFENLYLKNATTGQSVADLLTAARTSYTESSIQQFLSYSVMTNNHISDILLVDLQNRTVYLQSKSLNRNLISSAAFFDSALWNVVQHGKNEIMISPLYQPDYLSSTAPIMSIYLNLLDFNTRQTPKKFGAILMNVFPEDFFDAYKAYQGDSKSRIVITNGDTVCLDTKPQEQPFSPEKIQSSAGYIVNCSHSRVSDLTYYSIVDTRVLYKNTYDKLLGSILKIVLFCLAIGIGISVLIAHFFGKRLNKLSRHMELIQNGNLEQQLVVTGHDELSELETNLNYMSKRLKEYIDTIYVKDLRMKKFELKSLQMQINPHFMFNTLETIRSEAAIVGDDRAARMITLLGNLFRWNLRNKDMVNLESELEYLECYIELQEIVRGATLECTVCVPYGVGEYQIPKLTLQPILENAINHGYMQNTDVLHIDISLEEKQADFYIRIRDDGTGIPAEELMALTQKMALADTDGENLYHIGLRNIHQRIQMMMGDAFGVSVASTPGAGTCVTVHLPKYREGDRLCLN